MSAPSLSDRLRQKLHLKRYLEELSALTGRSVQADELGSLEQAAAMRTAAQTADAQSSARCEIRFSDTRSERFRKFLQRLTDANPSSGPHKRGQAQYIWQHSATMPRRPRIHLDGVPLHIVQRGHNREPYYFTEVDYHSKYIEPGPFYASMGQVAEFSRKIRLMWISLPRAIVSNRMVRVLALAVLLSACAEQDVSQKTVGTTKFCVPRHVLVKSDYYWLKDLPTEGFGFRIALPQCVNCKSEAGNEKKTQYEISGLVSTHMQYSARRYPPSPSSYTYKILFARDTKKELIEGKKFIKVEPAPSGPYSRDFFLWEANANSSELTPGAILAGGNYYAFCSERLGAQHIKKEMTISCDRLIFADPLAINYTFYFQDLTRTPEIEMALRGAIASWRCE